MGLIVPMCKMINDVIHIGIATLFSLSVNILNVKRKKSTKYRLKYAFLFSIRIRKNV